MTNPYMAIARPDHWIKHIFILPGIIFAYLLGTAERFDLNVIGKIIIGVIAACVISSANYTINEWLDSFTDIYHPEKRQRMSVLGKVRKEWVYIQYVVLAISGIALSLLVGSKFFYVSVSFFISGIIYNIQPIRTKDIAFLDVLTESLNNPIRLLLGWYMVAGSDSTNPPLTFIFGYYFIGAFLERFD